LEIWAASSWSTCPRRAPPTPWPSPQRPIVGLRLDDIAAPML